MLAKLFACILMLVSSAFARTPFTISHYSTEETIKIYWDDSLVFDRIQITGNLVEQNLSYHRSGFNVTSGFEMMDFLSGQTVEIFINATIGNEIYEASTVARTGI